MPQLSLSNVAAPCHRVLAIMRMEIIPSPGLGQREPLVNEYTAQFSPSLSVCVPIPIIRVVFFLVGCSRRHCRGCRDPGQPVFTS